MSSDFYKGERKSESETGDLMRNADHLNIVGEKSIKIVLDEDVIEDNEYQRCSLCSGYYSQGMMFTYRL